MTGGYSEGFNMSEVMKSRGKRPGFFEVPSVDTPISPRKKSPNKEINKPNYSYYFEQITTTRKNTMGKRYNQ
jgi:hypothetical protein